MSLVSLDSTNTLREIFSSQESPYQGAARACCPARAGDPEAEHDNKAGRGLTDKGPTAPKQGEQSGSGESNQLQPRVSKALVKFLAMRQVQGQAGQLNQQFRDVIRTKGRTWVRCRVSVSS